MIFDNGFDTGDAALYGGILGFVEESVKAEEMDEQELEEAAEEAVETYLDRSPDLQLRRLYNDNPALVLYLIKRAYAERAGTLIKMKEKEIKAVRQEMEEELLEQKANEKD